MSLRCPTLAAALLLGVGAEGAGGCALAARDLAPRAAGSLRGTPVALRDDPTVRGMRLVPGDLREARGWGAEPGGGVRASVAGVRILLSGDALLTAADRLPSAPSAVVAVPERMGAGFLFVIGSQVWKSDAWLGDVRPLVRAPSAIGDVLVGLDRAYLLSASGTLAAFDPRTGRGEDLGSLPASPRMGRLAALDAWRAVAVVDFRGALVTLDAGASWRPLDLGSEPVDVSTSGGALVVRGVDPSRQSEWWEVERNGHALRLAAAPALTGAPAPLADAVVAPGRPLTNVLGASPLAAAIEDGWPLADGTALVARDGTLARVRLNDGTIVQTATEAFGLRPARCHPLSLATPANPGAFGFVCGEPHGRTAVYRWDRDRSGLAEMRHFDRPREVLASGNGALAVAGPCGAEAPDGDVREDGDRAWCVMNATGQWSERHFRGEGVERARIVALADGRVALVRPPEEELATGRLTISDGVTARHLPLRFPLLRDDVTKALLRGVWLDGFEERRPGTLGGWVDAAGSLVGVEVALDGTVRVGEYIREAGSPVAAGRWAFGWTLSRRAFETTDGGMSWTKGLDVPEPIAPGGATPERACGPAGCIAAGWIKVGWAGALPGGPPAPLAPMLLARGTRSPPVLRLACERLPDEVVGPSPVGNGSRPGYGQPAAIAPGAPLPGFCGRAGPSRPSDAPAVVSEIADGMGWPRRVSPVAMVYTWGPQAGDWDKVGRWEVRWRSLWGGCGAASGPAPWSTPDAAGRSLARAGGSGSPVTLVSGDDASRALLVVHRAGGFDVTALDAARAPLAVHRADGDVFPDIEAALQSGARWYVASAQSPSQLSATVVWEIDGDTAREVARFARAGPEGRAGLHLVRRAEGRAIGIAVEGRPDATQPSRLWVDPVDPETGEVGEPEPLAPLDFGGRPPAVCTGDDDGWQVELPYAGGVDLDLGTGVTTSVQAPIVVLRVSPTTACVERVAGLGSDEKRTVAAGTPTGPLPSGRSLEVSLSSARTRAHFRCRVP